MKLRDHPLMNNGVYSRWLPAWIHTRTNPVKNVYGEIGILIDVFWFSHMPSRLFLRMDLNDEPYMGTFRFADHAFCRQLSGILKQHIGRSIKEIGELDLSFTL